MNRIFATFLLTAFTVGFALSVGATSIPRPEYPRPQLMRDKWMNLNGKWQFEFDFGVSGQEKGMHRHERRRGFERRDASCYGKVRA